MLETFSLATFSDLLDDGFRVRLGDGASVELRLVEASGTGLPQQPGGREPFSLVFRGPGTPILPQRIYSVEHGALGAFDLFLVPLTPDAGGGRYEAVFA